MRLTCPNCGARYEVDDAMISSEGRDVQCSNCSTTWFQPGRRTDQTAQRQAGDTAKTAPPPVAPPAATEAPIRREIDPAMREILREEAEREARLRRAPSEAVETQEEMPLTEAPDAENRARRRAELDNAADAFSDAAEVAASRPRRDLLPDIEEINSTLRATSDRAASEAEASDVETIDETPRRRRGVRMGFGLVLIFATAIVAIYANATSLAQMVPALAGPIDALVEQLNAARLFLDDIAQGLASGGSGDTQN